MRRSLALLAVIFLAGCSTSPGGTIVEAPPTKAVDAAQFGLAFAYPVAWGDWAAASPTLPAEEGLSQMSFTGLDAANRYPQTGKATVRFTLRRYDDGTFRYEEVCDAERSKELCDVTKQQDLLEEKQEFLQKAVVNGIPQTVQDRYDPSSAYVIREIRFYSASHRVDIVAMYDIGDFLVARQKPDQTDLYAVAKAVLGDAGLADPIRTLSENYPEDFTAMQAFYAEVDAMTESMKTPARE